MFTFIYSMIFAIYDTWLLMFTFIYIMIFGVNDNHAYARRVNDNDFDIISELLKRNIFTTIQGQLSYIDKINLATVCKQYHQPMLKTVDKYKTNVAVVSKMHPECIKLFGLDKLITYPLYTSVESIIGYTGYIDKIDPSLVRDTFMIGIDKSSRPFIVVKFKHDNKTIVNCFFQRYSNTNMEWACSSNGYVRINANNGYFITNGKLVHKLFKQNIQNIQQDIKWIHQCDGWKDDPDNLFKLTIDY